MCENIRVPPPPPPGNLPRHGVSSATSLQGKFGKGTVLAFLLYSQTIVDGIANGQENVMALT